MHKQNLVSLRPYRRKKRPQITQQERLSLKDKNPKNPKNQIEAKQEDDGEVVEIEEGEEAEGHS